MGVRSTDEKEFPVLLPPNFADVTQSFVPHPMRTIQWSSMAMMFVPFGIEIPMYIDATAHGTWSFVLCMGVESAYDMVLRQHVTPKK